MALLVAAVLVGPSLVDWNAHKARIVAEVRKATGRDFSIQGDMSLSLLPVPALKAQGVRLASFAGGSPEPMVELEELRVRIALFPLLEGTIQVERILLVEPKILLEVLPDGRRNWSFAEEAGQPLGTAAAGFDIRFDDVTIEDGSLIYRSAARGRDERIDDLNLRIVADSLRGPFAGKGSLRIHGFGGDFEATLGRLVEEGATPFNVVAKPAGVAARLQMSGAISSHPETVAVHGRLKGEGESLADLIDGLTGGERSWPTALARDFTVQGEVSVDQRIATVSDLNLNLGGFRLSGGMNSLLAPPFDARLTLSAAQLDLDQLLEAETQANAGANGDTAAVPSGDEGPQEAWRLPADADGRFELSVDALIYRGQLIRQLRIDTVLGDGALQLERATALLPGSSDVSLTGSLREADGEAQFNGHVAAASDNLRGLLQWVGVDVSAVPSDRLRRMSLSGRVTGSPKQMAVSDLDLRLDLSRVSGGLVIAPRRRPGFGVGLALDSINLDAYLPNGPGGDSGTPSAGETEAEGARPPKGSGLALLELFDANFNLRAGAVTLRGTTARDLQVDATLQRGVLEFRTARIGNLAGGEVSYVGRVDEIGGAASLDGHLVLSVDTPARLAPLFGLAPETLARLPGFTGEGQVTGSLEALALDAQVSGAGGNLELVGAVRPADGPLAFDLRLTGRHDDLAALLETTGHPSPPGTDLGKLDLALRIAGAPQRFEVSEMAGALGPAKLTGGFAVDLGGDRPAVSDLDLLIEAKHPDAGQIAVLAGLFREPPEGLGDLDLTARLNGGPGRVQVEDFAASLGPLEMTGAVGLALNGLAPVLESYDLKLAAKHPDFAALAAGLGLGAGAEGGLDLTARVQGGRGRMAVEDLAGKLGPVDLSGRVNAEFGGERPLFIADLKTGELPLAMLFGGGETGEASGAGGQGSERWSRDAIDLAGLRSFDARLNLGAAALTHNGLRIDQVGLSAGLTAGKLDLERFTGTVHGGAVQLAGSLDLREEIAASLAITAVEVDVGDLLRGQTGFDRVSGPVFVIGDFAAQGASEAELVSELSGTAEISGLLTFTRAPEGATENGSGELRTMADLPDLLVRALGRDPIRLAGNLTARAGTLRSEDIRLDGQPAYALTLAKIDLTDWTVDGVTDIYERSTGQPLISSIAYGGPLDAPEVERLDVPAGPAPVAEEPPVPEPEEQAVPGVEERAVPEVEEELAPLVTETDEPEPAESNEAAAPETDPPEPEAAPEPAEPATPSPIAPLDEDDLLRDLLKLGG